jgi:hypothetical protein
MSQEQAERLLDRLAEQEQEELRRALRQVPQSGPAREKDW